MTTPRFTEKLNGLPTTLNLMQTFDPSGLRNALERSKSRRVIAVGAGGSHVSAAYLATCRQTLGHAVTTVQTPMEAVLDSSAIHEAGVWIFSASADNADAAAVARAARARGCTDLVICTRNPNGIVANWVEAHGGEVHVFPVADAKDGYLATHSLIATLAGLLLATEAFSEGHSINTLDLLSHILSRSLDADIRIERLKAVANLGSDSTLVAIIDPQLMPLRSLIETSIWEAAICPVQVTDARNFAHGRHAWLHHRGDRTWIFAATGDLSRGSWEAIQNALPSQLPVITTDYNGCGRLETARALIDGLGWIEAMGASVGIDPGKPGTGAFAKAIYEDKSLEDLAIQLSSPVRQKLANAALLGTSLKNVEQAASAWHRHVDGLCNVIIGGLVIDYDGTVVTTESRFHPADIEIVTELVRLHHLGVVIAFASGRGKSLGHDLRRVLPIEMLEDVLVGYYNGGHLRMAAIDIEAPSERPRPNPIIVEVIHWMKNQPNLFIQSCTLDIKKIQIAINISNLARPHSFANDIRECPAIAKGHAKVLASAHSYDIVPSTSSKLRVVDKLKEQIGTDRAVFSIGDSGGPSGNDHALLARPHGVSVGTVCDDTEGTWSLYGTKTMGPAALLRILRAIALTEKKEIRLNLAELRLDVGT